MVQLTQKEKLPVWWIFILAPLGIILTSFFFYLTGKETQSIRESIGITQPRIFALLIYNIATGLAVLLYYFLLKSKKLNFQTAGYRKKLSKRGVFDAFIAFLLVSMLLYPLISSILAALDIPMFWKSIGETAIKQTSVQDLILGTLTAAILAPLTEDTIFRGYVYQMFSERTNKWIAIIVSALLFSLLHISFFGPGLTVWVFFFGVASAYLYYKHDSIYPSLLYHFINNIWAYVIVPLIF